MKKRGISPIPPRFRAPLYFELRMAATAISNNWGPKNGPATAYHK